MQRSNYTAPATFFSEKDDDELFDNQAVVYVVQDTYPEVSEIKNWRCFSLIQDAYKGDTAGLDHMWASSSAAPSVNDFDQIAKRIRILSGGQAAKMIDLDLRQESHAYLNDQAITYATRHNWINYGKTEQESQLAEDDWIQAIRKNPLLENVLTPEQLKTFAFTDGVTVEIKSVMNENEAAKKAGFEYKRLMVSDHMAPRQHEIDEFIRFVKSLPPNSWIHLHCRGGEGRSSTFLVMLDMLKNAGTVSFDEIIKRHASIPPYYDLSQCTRRCKELTLYYQKRYAFVQEFYQFASELSQGYRGTWSDWAEKNCFNRVSRP